MKNNDGKQKHKSTGGGSDLKKAGANFVVQGSILAAAGILVRIIGLFYRIPLMGIIDDRGNGYYTSAYSIYSILLIISSYSLPTAVSKKVIQPSHGRIKDGVCKDCPGTV